MLYVRRQLISSAKSFQVTTNSYQFQPGFTGSKHWLASGRLLQKMSPVVLPDLHNPRCLQRTYRTACVHVITKQDNCFVHKSVYGIERPQPRPFAHPNCNWLWDGCNTFISECFSPSPRWKVVFSTSPKLSGEKFKKMDWQASIKNLRLYGKP